MNDSRELQMRKSPALAGFLSMLPGAGQIYVGYYVAGFTNILVIAALITILDSSAGRGVEPFFGLFLTFFWVFNIVDAVRKAKLYNMHAMGGREEEVPTDSPLIGGVILLVIGAFLTLTITFGLDLDWLENIWPLFLLAAGGYLVFRYRRVKDRLEVDAMSRTARSQAAVPPVPPVPTAPAGPAAPVASPPVESTPVASATASQARPAAPDDPEPWATPGTQEPR